MVDLAHLPPKPRPHLTLSVPDELDEQPSHGPGQRASLFPIRAPSPRTSTGAKLVSICGLVAGFFGLVFVMPMATWPWIGTLVGIVSTALFALGGAIALASDEVDHG